MLKLVLFATSVFYTIPVSKGYTAPAPAALGGELVISMVVPFSGPIPTLRRSGIPTKC